MLRETLIVIFQRRFTDNVAFLCQNVYQFPKKIVILQNEFR